ncbi:hypothetical protein [Paenibacillus xylanexedens]|uniref:hypothetical protein n=1 Tax=Paenibacillus xylanexedens TaxID=528191 RepID=UPI003B02E589
MNPFPKDYELVELFESEPKIFDEEVPWYYNNLFFSLKRNDVTLVCLLQPAHGTLSLHLKVNNSSIYDLSFENVVGMEIEKSNTKEILKIILNDEDTIKTLLLETKPNIYLMSTTDKSFRM